MKTKTIKQTVNFSANPQDIYKMLMDSKLHAKFTGDVAKIGTKVGQKFSAYIGYITGINLELKPGKKIVQSWRGSDWPEGIFSKATFTLAKTLTGTKLTFTQTGVPLSQYKNIKQGWVDYYWQPMKEFLENK